ncbi:hypothetical protein GCM10009565_53040 [Amycolatopsis albidoflavus]
MISAGFTRSRTRSSKLTTTGAPSGGIVTGGSSPPAHATNVPARASPALTATGSMSNPANTSATAADSASVSIPAAASRSFTPRVNAATTDASYAPAPLFISRGPKYPRTRNVGNAPAAEPLAATNSPASSASARARPSDTAAAGSINPDTTRPTPVTPPRIRFAPPASSESSARRLSPTPGRTCTCPTALDRNVFVGRPTVRSPTSTLTSCDMASRTGVSDLPVPLLISDTVNHFPRFSPASRNATIARRTSPFPALFASGLDSFGTS